MGDILHALAGWMKKGLIVGVFAVMAVLTWFMLYDVFGGDLTFTILGFVFFSYASWTYVTSALTARENDDHTSGQLILLWAGVIFTLLVEVAMAVFEVLRMQTLIAVPDWMNSAIIGLITLALIFHAVTGIAYLAARAGYNQTIHRIFEATKRAEAEERKRKEIEREAIALEDAAADETIKLTKNLLNEAVPFIAIKKAPELADAVLARMGLGGDVAAQAAIQHSLDAYTNRLQTASAEAGRQAMKNEVIDGQFNANEATVEGIQPEETNHPNPTPPERARKP